MISPTVNLQRFLDAQQQSYNMALTEVKTGRKRTHWMWYIFPQMTGLGHSETSRYFGIRHMQEAAAYLAHPVLGKRLVEISRALLELPAKNPQSIFDNPDDRKLHSSVTLFSQVPGADPVFKEIIDRFFDGIKDAATLELINN